MDASRSEQMAPLDPETLWKPTPIWQGQPAYLIGGGSSLKQFDFQTLKGKNTIGANYAFRLGADVIPWMCFSDTGWFNGAKFELERYAEAGGNVVSCATSLGHLNIPWIKKMQRVRDGLLFANGAIGWNYSTGAMMINLAMYLGSDQIFLLGYDMARKEGVSHWHNAYAKVTDDASFARHTKGFVNVHTDLVRRFPGVRVFNVTDGDSRLPLYDRISMAQFKRVLASPVPAERKAA